MQNTHHELGAVELLLLAGLIAIEAAAVVVVALVALVLTVVRWSTPRVVEAPNPAGPVPVPFAHPLVAVAGELQALSCRSMASEFFLPARQRVRALGTKARSTSNWISGTRGEIDPFLVDSPVFPRTEI